VLAPGGSQWLAAPYSLWRVGLSSAVVFGTLGVLIGSTFAVALTVVGRRVAFRELSARHVVGSGVVGGVVVAAISLIHRLLVIGPPQRSWAPDIALAVALSAGTAWVMLRLARRAPEPAVPKELEAKDQWLAGAATRARSEHSARAT